MWTKYSNKLKFYNKLCFFRPPASDRSMAIVVDYPVPTLSTNDFKDRLKKYNLPFTEGHTCFRLPECNLCSPYKKPTGKSSEVFVNKQTGYFLCELCKCSGSWQAFEHLIVKSGKAEGERGMREVLSWRDGCIGYHDKGQQSWKKLSEDLQKITSFSDEEQLSIYSSFKLTPCSSAVAEKLNIFLSHDRETMYMPILSSSQLILGYIAVNSSGKTVVVPKIDCAGFLTYAPKKKASKAVIVSNLQDFFSLLSSNVGNIHVLCLPYGVSSLPQISLPFLEDYENLTLWFGYGPGAWDATRNFAKKLNEKRCCVIRSSDPLSSPSDAVLNGTDIKKMMDQALPTWHQAITSFSSLRDEVLQELRNHEQVLGIQWKRFPPLNKILRGHRRGELTILTGPTGSGKTTFMSEYSLDLAAQGVNTLWGSFEVRNVRLARTMLQQHVGQALEEHLDNYENWANEFELLPIYFLTFHGQQSIKTVMDAVQHASYVHDIGHVIIDNVQFMIGMTDDNKYQDRFLKQDLIIHAFRTFATRANCHVTLVIHPRKERDTDDLTTSSIFGGAKAAQEADNVLIIQDKRLVTAKGKKYLQVCKNRYTGDLGMMVLNFDKGSLSYGKLKKEKEVNCN